MPQTDQAPLAIMFDIDSTLITVDGAGSRSWAHAFRRLYGVDADITAFTEQGMTDPEVARRTFIGAVGRPATAQDLARLMAAYLERLEEEVERSPGYRTMPGVEALLPSLAEAGILLGLVPATSRWPPVSSSGAVVSIDSLRSAGMAPIPPIAVC